MKKLKIEKNSKNNDTLTRTIRISGTTFDQINELAEKNNFAKRFKKNYKQIKLKG